MTQPVQGRDRDLVLGQFLGLATFGPLLATTDIRGEPAPVLENAQDAGEGRGPTAVGLGGGRRHGGT